MPWALRVGRRSPAGLPFLALLAAPGLAVWSCAVYALLAPPGAPGRGIAASAAFPLAFVALGAGAAFGCRARRPIRWLVGAIDLAALPWGFLMLFAASRL